MTQISAKVVADSINEYGSIEELIEKVKDILIKEKII